MNFVVLKILVLEASPAVEALSGRSERSIMLPECSWNLRAVVMRMGRNLLLPEMKGGEERLKAGSDSDEDGDGEA